MCLRRFSATSYGAKTFTCAPTKIMKPSPHSQICLDTTSPPFSIQKVAVIGDHIAKIQAEGFAQTTHQGDNGPARRGQKGQREVKEKKQSFQLQLCLAHFWAMMGYVSYRCGYVSFNLFSCFSAGTPKSAPHMNMVSWCFRVGVLANCIHLRLRCPRKSYDLKSYLSLTWHLIGLVPPIGPR